MKNLNKVLLLVPALSVLSVASLSSYAASESFESSIKLIDDITITELASLRFPQQVAGTAQTVVVAPADSGAAQFSATGSALASATATIAEANIEMTTGDGVGSTKRITVNSFTLGGTLAADGTVAFAADGTIDNMRVGGSAVIENDDISGDYTGTATFELNYS